MKRQINYFTGRKYPPHVEPINLDENQYQSTIIRLIQEVLKQEDSPKKKALLAQLYFDYQIGEIHKYPKGTPMYDEHVRQARAMFEHLIKIDALGRYVVRVMNEVEMKARTHSHA